MLYRAISFMCPSSTRSSTEKYQKHEPFSFCFFVCSSNRKSKPPIVYRGSDASKVFMEAVTKEAREIEKLYSINKEIFPLSSEKEKNSTTLLLCAMLAVEFLQ
ncbi:hypothetical protein AVEN_230833-1 [Araneus ventricosus]|uniref:Uncharacterized protein n=1 Tax=Araneus ventricosus TaxID=182803 RepID=A0A4Y2A2W5_ARAVE|nr:hypothetical protein AVEN_230833-1 [Araneus ventricosus]